VKLRLLLTSALFVLTQISAPQAQETLDFAKITCDQFVGDKLTPTNRDIVNWLSGYYHGKHSGTIVEPQTLKQNEEKIYSYCSHHTDTTVMDAVDNMLAGSDK
jgi:hypothetical protein